MAVYRIEGTLFDTRKSTRRWEERTRWNGSNHISVATGSQWEHQTLYQSSKGRYFLVHSSQWQGSSDRAELLSSNEAATWLLAMGEDLPRDLQPYESEVLE